MQAFGILIFFVEADGTSCVTTRVPVRERMSHKIVVGDLKKRVHGGWLVALPVAQVLTAAESREHRGVGLEEEPGPRAARPGRQAHRHRPSISSPTFSMLKTCLAALRCDEPVPERRAEVEAVVQVLGLDEDVGVEQVRHQSRPQAVPELPEGRELREAEHAEGVSVQRLAFERADDERAGEALADPRRLRQVEVAAASLGNRPQPLQFRLVGLPEAAPA